MHTYTHTHIHTYMCRDAEDEQQEVYEVPEESPIITSGPTIPPRATAEPPRRPMREPIPSPTLSPPPISPRNPSPVIPRKARPNAYEGMEPRGPVSKERLRSLPVSHTL